MRNFKLVLKTLLSLTFMFVLLTCGETIKYGTLHELNVSLYDEQYWGEWIRMDTGDIWYFSSNYRKVGNDVYVDPVTMERQSQNVIHVTEGTGTSKKDYYLYASRIRNSTFEAKAVIGIDGASRRARRDGLDDFNAAFSNLNNDAENFIIQIGGNGEIEANDIIAGDDYKVIIDNYEFIVTPNTDGDNVGTLTLTDGVNIKTSIVPQSSSVDLMRLYSGKSYDLTIKFTNIGEDVCAAMSYQLVLPSGIKVTGNKDSPSLLTSGNLKSIMPGVTKNVDITVECGPIIEDYEFKEIVINTVDLDNKTWEDSVSLKINKESVTFKIRSNSAINGVVIVPNGKTYFFKTDGGWWSGVYSADVTVPKYLKEYLIVFSGASADTEATYSFAVGNEPAVDFDKHLITNTDLNKYWPNNTEALATLISSAQEVMAYLRMNNANYYKVKFNK